MKQYEQTSCQVIENSLVGNWNHKQEQEKKVLSSHSNFWFWFFEAINEVKKIRNKVFIKSQKIPILSFIAINQEKEQGTCIFGFVVKKQVTKPETKFLLTL